MSVSLNKNDYITIAGTVLAAAGAFMPMLNIAHLGTISYAKAADPQVYFLVAFAVLASVVIFLGKRAFALYAAVGAWIVLLWPVLKNIGSGGGGDDGGLMSKVTNAASDPLQKVAGKLFNNVFDLELGGYVFLIGMILLIVGGVMTFKAAREG
ncbi:hypothetical protein [Kordiimonas marina]|uniref:hypothetical protein n=1 Tax=Kordiimonas marina TaxID=2872312 RepID=UPI001FF0F022|nr:hypothetical protein [Kordiimonas marina]MCJ9429143.1 hypothetical protein [Kordiimonas marina]